jgi:hypothetical protein
VVKKEYIQHSFLYHVRNFFVHASHVCERKILTLLKNCLMDKYVYDFRIQPAEIVKEDIKYFKQ